MPFYCWQSTAKHIRLTEGNALHPLLGQWPERQNFHCVFDGSPTQTFNPKKLGYRRGSPGLSFYIASSVWCVSTIESISANGASGTIASLASGSMENQNNKAKMPLPCVILMSSCVKVVANQHRNITRAAPPLSTPHQRPGAVGAPPLASFTHETGQGYKR